MTDFYYNLYIYFCMVFNFLILFKLGGSYVVKFFNEYWYL